MAWNKDVPAAGIQARYVDDGVRTNNAALEDALGRDHEFPGTMSSTAGMHNVVQLIDQAGDEAAHATVAKLWNNAGKLRMIIPSGTAVTVDAFPSGTIMVFGQNSAPTGWTRKADWQDNAMLCYAASGNIGSGGAVNPQSAHTHTGPSHTHTGPSHTHDPGTLQFRTIHRAADGSLFGYSSAGANIELTNDKGINNGDGTLFNMHRITDTSYIQAYTDNGTGVTGAGGTAATGASGTAATGSNSAPYFQEVIACVKD